MKTGAVADGLAYRTAVEEELAHDRPEYDLQFHADMRSYLASSLRDRGRPDRDERPFPGGPVDGPPAGRPPRPCQRAARRQACPDRRGTGAVAGDGVLCTIDRLEVGQALGRFDDVRAASGRELAAGDIAAAAADVDEAIAVRKPHDDDDSLWLADLWVQRAECTILAGQTGAADQALAEAGRIHRSHGTVAASRSQRLAQVMSQGPQACSTPARVAGLPRGLRTSR